jgi:hypothetical protein
MVHPVLATRPRLGHATRMEGRGKPGRLSVVTSPWDAQWKGVGWAARVKKKKGRLAGPVQGGVGFWP